MFMLNIYFSPYGALGYYSIMSPYLEILTRFITVNFHYGIERVVDSSGQARTPSIS